MLKISLIICTKNRSDMIADVLKSAINQSLNSKKYEVIIVDQSTNKKTQELVRNFPDFKYIKIDSTGLSVSRNQGIKHSQGKILVFVDDDVLFDENYLKNILDFFDNSELKPDFIGGKTHIKYLSQKPDWIDGPLLGILAYSDYGNEPLIYDSHPKHVPYGCNMAIKRECLEKIGGFSNYINNLDPDLTENEDVILANKLRNMGYNLAYCPQMLVYHKMPASRLTYEYYKKRYFSQGCSDAYIYYLLKMYCLKNIPKKLLIHSKRLFESLILKYFKNNLQEKYYQRLRLYYNFGYLKALFNILLG
ncbi:MAG: glycosyltransferase [bacterium]